MKRATRKAVAALAIAAALWLGFSVPCRADVLSDPRAFYDAMKGQFDTGTAHGWQYADWLDYFSTIVDAGRAYAARKPDDPNAIEVANLAVDVATKLRYDPLSNRDAAEWYVRDAAVKGIASGDPDRAPQGRALLERLDRIEVSPAAMARGAETDATANAQTFPGDERAQVAQVETTWKAWLLTKDTSYRTLALARAAANGFPVTKLSDPIAGDLYDAARGASDRGLGYTAKETEAGRAIVAHMAASRDPRVIARVETVSHDSLMVMRAPADEYFGRMKMSVLGIRNEIDKINKYLDVGWGSRMAGEGQLLADAVDAWHREYPRDSWLPDALLRSMKALMRIDAEPATTAAKLMRHILIIEYTNSAQARELLAT